MTLNCPINFCAESLCSFANTFGTSIFQRQIYEVFGVCLCDCVYCVYPAD